MTIETAVPLKVFQFTTVGGLLLTQRIRQIEALAAISLQDGKSLDRTVSTALAAVRAACDNARASVD